MGLVGAIAAVVLFFPTGVPALAAALKSRRLWREGAKRDSRIAAERCRDLVWYSVGIGLTLGAVGFFIALLTANGGGVRRAFFDVGKMRDFWPALVKGFRYNVSLFLVAEVLVLIWALVVAIARGLPGKASLPIRFLATAYVDVFRGLPAVIVIYLVGLGFSTAGLPVLKDMTDFQLATFALTLTYGAYVAEVYRAGIESIHYSQIAGARSLGLTYAQTMKEVVVPQAVRRIIPPLLNDFIGLQKDTALVGFIGALDAFNRARIFSGNRANLSAVTAVAIAWVVITIPMARLLDWVVRRDQQKMRVSGAATR